MEEKIIELAQNVGELQGMNAGILISILITVVLGGFILIGYITEKKEKKDERIEKSNK